MPDVRNLIAQGHQVPLVPKPGEDPYTAQLAQIRKDDPPLFALQASPSYAGGTLPDSVWQRVPIGGAGQVLTVDPTGLFVLWANSPAGFANPMTTAGDTLFENVGPVPARLAIGTVGQVLTVSAGLLPVWAAPVTGFSNPMTTLGDIITATGGGGAVRLGIGTTNQVLTVSGGAPVWANAVTGFTNPMTTAGDIIFENATPAPARLAIGANGQVLTISGGLPSWQNSAAGFTNPMTTLGDIITAAGGGTAQRLAVGGAGQVLGISAGVPAWVNSPSGFANPMTAIGDMISGSTGGAAQRLPAGSTGQYLTMGATQPGWTSVPWIVVQASGDTTGSTDISNINAAFASLPNGGYVYLEPSTYYIGSAGISVPPYVFLVGSGHNTVINCVGGGTGTYILQYNTADPASYMRISGGIREIVVDGTSAGNGAIGVNIQDMNGCEYRMGIRNFSGTGSTGLQIANNTHSTNNLKGHIRTENCTNHVVFNTLGAQNAIEHIYLTYNMNVSNGQNAISLLNSVGIQGSDIVGDAGVAANAGPVFSFAASTVFSDCRFLFKAEGGGGTGTTVSFTGAGSGFVRCVGILWFSPSMGNSNQVAQLGQVSFQGSIPNDPTLSGEMSPPPNSGTYDLSVIVQPGFPGASGTAVTNNTLIPAWVTVAGGTLSAATQVNGVNVGDVNTRVFLVPRGQTIKLTWSSAPTGWLWQPVG